jgi:hypothetical protein
MVERFRNCFNAQLARKSNSKGTVQLSFRVDCEGIVRTIKARAKGIERETVECMFQASNSERFEPPRTGSAVINVPVVFVPARTRN